MSSIPQSDCEDTFGRGEMRHQQEAVAMAGGQREPVQDLGLTTFSVVGGAGGGS